MRLWLSYFYLLVVLCTTIVNSKVDLESQIKLAQCRATCLFKINMLSSTDKKCKSSRECSQCWDSCKHLQNNAESQRYCSQVKCNRGCREACRFHFLGPSLNVTLRPLVPHHEETLHLQVGVAGVSWPPIAGPDPVVYVVLPSGLQTLDHHSELPGGQMTRVLGVDRQGLSRVISPQAETPLDRVRTVLRSLGLNLPVYMRRINDSANYTPIANSEISTKSWQLKVVSLALKSSLVQARISWPPLQDQLTYLVTWEVEGGIIRGNLLTNATIATLSLWPDTSYRIQVSAVDPETKGGHSEPLFLDTHHLQAKSPVDPHHLSESESRLKSQRKEDQTLIIVAGVVIMILITLVTTWRSRHILALPHSKLIDEEVGTPNIYRVFPPAVRLISESKDHYPEMFSSTDNLLRN